MYILNLWNRHPACFCDVKKIVDEQTEKPVSVMLKIVDEQAGCLFHKYLTKMM
jgi:hypothetical protein